MGILRTNKKKKKQGQRKINNELAKALAYSNGQRDTYQEIIDTLLAKFLK